MLESLEKDVKSHIGQFLCVEIHNEKNTKTVNFRHVGSPPNPTLSVPPIQGLREFYAIFEHLTLYLDEQSRDAAYYIASPSQWSALNGYFRPWLDGVDEEEAEEYLPDWIDDCLVVGEIPQSGNYLLIPSSGQDAGRVFEFEHDGFEFLELATSLPAFVKQSLDLNNRRLTIIASHLRFVVGDESRQWWIKELKDNRGNVAHTES